MAQARRTRSASGRRLRRGRPAGEWDRGFRNLLLAEHVAHVLRQGRVNCVLDEVTAHVPERRCFLKMDTQGFDLEVFRGLGERAAELQGLQSEVAAIPIYEGVPPMLDVLAAYERQGFGLTGLLPVARDPHSSRVIEFDCVMVRT